jgi:hypothetical protein
MTCRLPCAAAGLLPGQARAGECLAVLHLPEMLRQPSNTSGATVPAAAAACTSQPMSALNAHSAWMLIDNF